MPKDKLEFFKDVKKHVVDDLTNQDGEWSTIGFTNGVQEASYMTQKRSLDIQSKKLIQYGATMIFVYLVTNWILSEYLPRYLLIFVPFLVGSSIFGTGYLTK